MYLIYTTEQSAIDRAIEEGRNVGLSYYSGFQDGTKYLSYPFLISGNKFALNVSDYHLTEEEFLQTVETVNTFPQTGEV